MIVGSMASNIESGLDPLTRELLQVLDRLEAGETSIPETRQIDFKEEAGRRGPGGVILPGEERNEDAATKLAQECACMANTEGGGILILGVSDRVELIGTSLNVEWLRHRIYELTQRLVTPSVDVHNIRNVRLLVIRIGQALEPVRWNDKIMWRVADNCVEVDATTWHERRMSLLQYDWSAQPSGVPLSDVREISVGHARDFLRQSGDSNALELAEATTPELLRRLGVISPDGTLTNAGQIAFVGMGRPALDYIRRPYPGGDSQERLRSAGRGVLEELYEVMATIRTYNPIEHAPKQIVVSQARELPELAAREAIVNGIAHRDWGTNAQVVIEHVRASLTVTSPGGFIGGVNSTNIITHPSAPRNRALAELFARLRVAEREGIGVDRMVKEMLRLGRPAPTIEEMPGPSVKAVLAGGLIDYAWVEFLELLTPGYTGNDLYALVLLTELSKNRWFDIATATELLQLNETEARSAVESLMAVRFQEEPVIALVDGIPPDSASAWCFTRTAGSGLAQAIARNGGNRDRAVNRDAVALHWARARGRVSSTELGSILGVAPSNLNSLLRSLENQGLLLPSRENRRGPGFFYLPEG